jgi:ACT domain-containing protein
MASVRRFDVNIQSLIRIAPFAASLIGCSVYSGGGGGGGGGSGSGSGGSEGSGAPNPDPENVGEMFEVVGADQVLMNPEIDPDVTVPSDGPKPSLDVSPGDLVTVAIPFSAPMGNVVGVGVAFGLGDPVQVVSMPDALGMTGGTAQLQFQVPASVCDGVSEICHQVECFEFAVTDIGRVSAANINQIAVACNGCDEPSCQMLLQMCQPPIDPAACATIVAKDHECTPSSLYTVEECLENLVIRAREGGPDCVAGYESMFVCLSQLDCTELYLSDECDYLIAEVCK